MRPRHPRARIASVPRELSVQKRLFPSAEEKLSVYLPLLLITLFLLQQLLWKELTARSYDWIELAANVVFLNNVHLAFTYGIVFFHPAARRWARAKAGAGPLRFWTLFWLLHAALFAGFLLLARVLYPAAGIRGDGSVAFLLALAVVGNWHFLAQSFGISQLHGKVASATGTAKAEKRERALFRLLILAITVFLPLRFFQGENLPLTALMFAATLALAAAIIANSWLTPHWNGSSKTLFLTRLLIWPFLLLSPAANAVLRAVHGLEYLFVFRKLFSGRKAFRLPALFFAFLALFAPAFVASNYISRLLTRENSPLFDGSSFGIWFLHVAFAVNLTCTVSHYLIDRLLFTMRHPENRRFTGRLLTKAPLRAP